MTGHTCQLYKARYFWLVLEVIQSGWVKLKSTKKQTFEHSIQTRLNDWFKNTTERLSWYKKMVTWREWGACLCFGSGWCLHWITYPKHALACRWNSLSEFTNSKEVIKSVWETLPFKIDCRYALQDSRLLNRYY